VVLTVFHQIIYKSHNCFNAFSQTGVYNASDLEKYQLKNYRIAEL